MIFVESAVLLALLVLLGAGETPAGRALHRACVKGPADRLLAVRRGTAVACTGLLLVVALVLWFGGGDGARMLAMGAPETLAWFTTFEFSAYTDALVAVLLSGAALRWQGWRGLLRGLPRRRTRPRSRRARQRRTPRPLPPANDDHPGMPALAA